MPRVLSNEREIKMAIDVFHQQIKETFIGPTKGEFTFPGCSGKIRGNLYSHNTEHGVLSITLPHKNIENNRMLHFIRLRRRKDHSSSDVELNIPLEINKTVNMCLVEDKEKTMICSRGKFTAYTTPIRKHVTLNFFKDRVISVADRGDDTLVIPITTISSLHMAEDLAEFVNEVKIFKAKFKRGEL